MVVPPFTIVTCHGSATHPPRGLTAALGASPERTPEIANHQEHRDTASKRGILAEGIAFNLLFVVMIAACLLAEKGTRDYRVTQSGLFTFILFGLAWVPLRIKWALHLKNRRYPVRPVPTDGYLRSGRATMDLVLAQACLASVFLLDLSFVPQNMLRIGVAAAVSFVVLAAAVLVRRYS